MTEEMAVRVAGLYCSYGWQYVLRDIHFEVRPGNIAVLIGSNGVGKSTLLSTLGGALSPTRGEVSVFGNRRRVGVEEESAARGRTMYLPERSFLPGDTMVTDFLGAVSELFEIPRAVAIDRIDSLLKLFTMQGMGTRFIKSLSTGQAKKVSLCAALLADRPLLLLDEPFGGGLDPQGILALRQVLQHRVRERGQTIILTTPVAEIVSELADQLLILRDEHLAENLTRAELLERMPGGQFCQDGINELVFPEARENVRAYLDSQEVH
ncbi:MAG: ATP-binding cassette domain-containing protein [Planctomycetaceae bacterium]|nr:ABC transporter ATP-binding protein [Planctomycetaceae bacterium]